MITFILDCMKLTRTFFPFLIFCVKILAKQHIRHYKNNERSLKKCSRNKTELFRGIYCTVGLNFVLRQANIQHNKRIYSTVCLYFLSFIIFGCLKNLYICVFCTPT
jgi:hypothetical protein